VGLGRRALVALGKVGIVLSVLVAFLFGMLGTVYLSLRTAEVKVPDVLGQDRFAAEKTLEDAGLKLRVRGARPSTEKKPDTILSQLPEAGLTVKTGIEVAVEVSRTPKEGERAATATEEEHAQETEKPADNANQATSATNQNQNQNQNKPPKNKNTNKNANNKNANNSNNSNNANRNANNRNANANRNANNGNRNANANANRPTNNSTRNANANTIRRPPAISTPPFNPGANRGTP
jgi:beta-lactam-binding protein with PASTA domain